MIGPPRCLVSQSSATSCLPARFSADHAIPIGRTHSDLVKFGYHDPEYDKVFHTLKELCCRALERVEPERGIP
jgi:protein SERAC1